ncbi:MAG TPA: hypothetical protein VGH67_00625 [Solirubrobacteraceae bacterium]|jgi:hypothetical protein
MSITKGRSTTMKHSRILRLPAAAVTIALAGLVLAACGSSSNTGSSTSTSTSASAAGAAGGASSAARSKLVACLKAHGVTLPARPAGARRRPQGGYGGYGGGAPGFFFGGGGSNRSGAPGAGRFANPKFRAALQACGAGRFPQRRATPNKAAVTKFAACVKQHGYNLPSPNFSGKGPVFPAAIARNKTFQAAAKACASDLRPQGAGAGGAGSAPPGSGSSSD